MFIAEHCEAVSSRISRFAIEDRLQPLRRHRQLRDGAGNADGVVDRGGDRAADAVDAALARALDAERIERRRIVLGQDDLDVRRLAHGRQQIVGEGDGQRIAALVVGELLVERAAEPLREAAGDLALHQRRVDGAADVVGDDIALDLHAAGVADRPSPPRDGCRRDRPGGRRRTSLRPTGRDRGRRAASRCWRAPPRSCRG